MKKGVLIALITGLTIFAHNYALAQNGKKYIAVVHTNTGKRYSGIITEVTEKNFSIKASRGIVTFNADTIERIKVRSKHALNNNMFLGSLIGLGGGALIYHNQEAKGNVTPIVLPVLVISSIVNGAAFGAFVNSFFAKERFTDVSANYRQINKKLALYARPLNNY